jgi:hypothetical protein
MSSPYVVVENFLRPDIARALREDTKLYFANSSATGAAEIWGYRRVPHGHVCLHTISDKVISRFKVEMFVGALRNWATQNLGFGAITHPSLSVSSGGSGEALHGEPRNGRFGYVYFLTKPQEGSQGGNILVTSEIDNSRHAIEARFNRLLVFDDRIARTMEYGDGSLDPLAGLSVGS